MTNQPLLTNQPICVPLMKMAVNLIFKNLIFKLFICFLLYSNSLVFSHKDFDEVSLKPNEQHAQNDGSGFTIFCYTSVPKSMFYIWRSVELVFENVPSSYKVFTGDNTSDILHKKEAQSILDPTSWFSGQKTKVEFPAFSNHCIGISANENYVINFKVKTIDYWRFLQTIVGVGLFLSAPSLSRNPFFHYTSGMSIGVLLSVFLLFFILQRFIPKKSVSYAIFFCGFSFVSYLLHSVYSNLSTIISGYSDLVIAYCLVTSFISFVVCYRMGPVKNVRTFNIIQWSMQIIAAVLIYLSSEYREVSMATVIVLVTLKNIPSSWISKCLKIWYRYFPPKIQLLTELQYIEQGHIETKKALDELRKYCQSPDCNAWKTVQRLQNPMRFAEFISSGSHCSNEELLRYSHEELDEFSEEDSIETTQLENNHTQFPSGGLFND